ncbi:MAG TPA: DUF1570 domain-containing protein, partial [Candidatus Polarisedimenticolia bacterium]|nr:DUF1570 domain-containing protein [Candidatus Polarisedimenticolia bacterium]
ARKLIADENLDVATTAHFVIRTDDPRIDVKAAAELMEGFRDFFVGFWSGRAELAAYDGPGQVFLFYSRYKYKQLFDQKPAWNEEVSPGHYRPVFDAIVAHTDTLVPEDLPDMLVHEATHQLVERMLYPEDFGPSGWVTEGLGQYFEHTLRDDSGAFQAGRTGGKNLRLFEGAPGGRSREAARKLSEHRARLKKDEALSLASTLEAGPASFYGPDERERYTVSWLLVHYLIHADAGAHLPGFVAFIKQDGRGEADAAALAGHVGMTPEQLEAAFKSYVLDLKLR